jgi:hypothetical protein
MPEPYHSLVSHPNKTSFKKYKKFADLDHLQPLIYTSITNVLHCHSSNKTPNRQPTIYFPSLRLLGFFVSLSLPMHGHRPPYRPGGRGQPPQRHPLQQELPTELLTFNPNFVPLQDPNFFLHTFTNALLQQNFPMQNPNFPIQNPNFFLPPQQQIQYRQQQHQEPPPPGAPPPPEQQEQQQEPATLQQNLPKFPQNPKKKVKQNNKELQLERIDRAVEKARQDLSDAEENVSAWKVSQSVLVNFQAESWESLGFKMQEVPALFRLMVTESKVISTY